MSLMQLENVVVLLNNFLKLNIMNFSFNKLSALTKFLLGMAFILTGVFLKVLGLQQYFYFQVLLLLVGLMIQILAVISFLKNRK